MKLAVLLALFSVCHANFLGTEVQRNNLDVVKEAFWDYVAKATLTAEEALKQIRESEMGQELNSRISQSSETANRYLETLKTQASPLTQEFITRFTDEAEQLQVRLQGELTAMSSTVRPHADQLLAQIQARVEELKKEVAPYAASLDPEAAKATLLQKSQELKEQLDSGVAQLQVQMVPLADDVKLKMEQSVEQFLRNTVPLAESLQVQLAQKSQELQDKLAPLGEDMKSRLEAGTQDLQAQLTALWDTFAQKTQ